MKENSISETDIKELLSALLNSVDIRNYYKELFTSNVEILELLFDNYFEKVEGSNCSHDKSSFTVNKILKSLSTKEVYSLQETYDIKKHPRMIEYEGKRCYWCPKTFNNTDEAISFAYAIMTLDFEKLTQFMEQH